MSNPYLILSTNDIQYTGLANSETPAVPINNAVITVTIVTTSTGVAVAGVSWPQTLDYVPASDGDYLYQAPKEVEFVRNAKYTTQMTIVGGGLDSYQECTSYAVADDGCA